ncbi:DUF4328 domain-containing protein [Dokdonia sp. Dokd-P16]|uniref:DUF4328 domain-containing protein n=1 Tax=Dokdonia sp. Dokd-P16 TaxID=2173169 RepID=UPI0013A583D3|nr:DUF4328 domain-containing protein [Dokdonia sp. Dokd-P16]
MENSNVENSNNNPTKTRITYNVNAIKPNLKRAKIAQTLIWLVMILDIFSIISSYLQYDILRLIQNDEFVTEQALNANDTREQIVAILYTIIFITSTVTFIQWFRRAYYNLNIRTKTNHTDGWAAGSWFVPIISLYRPYQIMKEMWKKTTRLIKAKDSNYLDSNTTVIGLWWTLWIVSNYVGNYVLKSIFKEQTIETLMNSTIADMVMSILGIPLAIVTVTIIKNYSSKEEKISSLEKQESI